MDRLKKYQGIVGAFFEERAAIQDRQKSGLKSHLIVNEKKTDFLLLAVGRVNKLYIHNVSFHLEIQNEKIWIWADNMDFDVATTLVEEGVDKNDIVLGFLSPLLREFSEYAVA